eukprot:m.157737 g.157737  ORF g.157737 m.157737 type:complete len:536 (+) comp31062_c1_seq1:122-1729(+)
MSSKNSNDGVAKVGKKIFKVAVIGVGCENCSFSTMSTTMEDFNPMLDVAALQRRYSWLNHAAVGDKLDLEGRTRLEQTFSDAEFFPICNYRAIPGGPIASDTMKEIMDTIQTRLGQLVESEVALDGVYLDLHGAMFATDYVDVEGGLSTMVRDVVGPDAMITASFDLHGNFSKTMAQKLDMVTAYRTAPHIDISETKLKAVNMLLTALRLSQRPTLAYVQIPLAISGEMSNTADQPSKRLYNEVLHLADEARGVLDASIFIGYCWADELRSGGSIIVSGFDADVIKHEALRIAAEVWKVRGDFRFGVEAGTIDTILDRARSFERTDKNKPVIISDSGDNPTAGGVGDTPCMIEHMIRKGIDDAIVQGPVDAAAVGVCITAGVGAEVELSLGGKLDYVNAKPLLVKATVKYINTSAEEYQVNLSNGTANNAAALVAIKTGTTPESGGEILVTLTASRKPFHYESDFRALQAEPTLHKILSVKIGYLVPDLERLASINLMALSPGSVYADIETMAYKNIRRPIYPLDKNMEWTPCLA